MSISTYKTECLCECTTQIDLDLITTGAGQQQRRLRGDLKREVRPK